MKRIFLLEDDETLGRGIAMALTGPEVSVVCVPLWPRAGKCWPKIGLTFWFWM